MKRSWDATPAPNPARPPPTKPNHLSTARLTRVGAARHTCRLGQKIIIPRHAGGLGVIHALRRLLAL